MAKEIFTNGVEFLDIFSKDGMDYIVVDDPEISSDQTKYLRCIILDHQGKVFIENKKAKADWIKFYTK